MKESYEEGLAPHLGLESCANLPRGGREALTGADAGWVFVRGRIEVIVFADLWSWEFWGVRGAWPRCTRLVVKLV